MQQIHVWHSSTRKCGVLKVAYLKTPFSYLSIHQYSNSIGRLRGHLQGHITSMISDDLRGSSIGQVLSLLANSYEFESS